MDPTPSPPATDQISADLRLILRAILAVLGMWKLEVPQLVLTHRRITRAFQRIELLLVRFRAGKIRPSTGETRQVAARQDGPSQTVRKATPSITLPRKFGWLVAAGGYQAAGYGGQLQYVVLNTPEMKELLTVCPQARRTLRPWCRALAIDLPWVRGGPRKPRVCKPRPKPEPQIWPRGFKTWIRKEKRMEKLLKLKHELVLQMAQQRVG